MLTDLENYLAGFRPVGSLHFESKTAITVVLQRVKDVPFSRKEVHVEGSLKKMILPVVTFADRDMYRYFSHSCPLVASS